MTQNTEQLIQETMESYYDYVVKIKAGCTTIIQSLKDNEVNVGIKGIIDLSEGLAWLVEAEELLEVHSYKIESPISQFGPLFEKMNIVIEASNFEEVVRLIEDELKPLFKNASEWKFEEVVS